MFGHKIAPAFMTLSTSVYLNSIKTFKLSEFPNLSGNHRVVAPPESIPNSEVKRNIADGSVGSPHVRVGHFQAPNLLARVVISPLPM